ncbi:hypothetical protein PSTT_15096 [Puccinia striiformis]|uniref:Uncharacterized protein n=1 Tax=Puccinia striiformis TaxID=27350 RepID=A0A2S4UJF4_9BASI|nr:hypothetical protein PSTT_15096 [Puccinia striiformis]
MRLIPKFYIRCALQPSFRDATKKELHRGKGTCRQLIHSLHPGRLGLVRSNPNTLQYRSDSKTPHLRKSPLFVDVEQKGPRIDPYHKVSSLHYQLLARPKIPKTVVICIKESLDMWRCCRMFQESWN